MNIIKLTFANLKRYIKMPSILMFLILSPIVLILFCSFLTKDSSDDSSMSYENIGIVCNLNLEYSLYKSIDTTYQEELIKELNIQEDDIYSLDQKDKAVELLKNNKFAAIFVINDDFSDIIKAQKRPTIDVIKTSEGGGSLLTESKIDTFINTVLQKQIDPNFSSKYIKSTVVKDEGIILKDDFISIFLICYVMYISGCGLCTDLVNLKKSNTLKRMLSTKNKDFEILFSLFFSSFLIQAIVYTIVLIISNKFIGITVNPYTILLILANCFLCTGIIICLSRYCKNESTISLSMVGYIFLRLATSISILIPSLVNIDMPVIINISKFMPMYWTMDAMMNDNYVKNSIILVLMGLFFITAGSFKLKEFAKN